MRTRLRETGLEGYVWDRQDTLGLGTFGTVWKLGRAPIGNEIHIIHEIHGI